MPEKVKNSRKGWAKLPSCITKPYAQLEALVHCITCVQMWRRVITEPAWEICTMYYALVFVPEAENPGMVFNLMLCQFPREIKIHIHAPHFWYMYICVAIQWFLCAIFVSDPGVLNNMIGDRLYMFPSLMLLIEHCLLVCGMYIHHNSSSLETTISQLLIELCPPKFSAIWTSKDMYIRILGEWEWLTLAGVNSPHAIY